MKGSVNRPINPLRVAQKMHDVRNFENFALFEEFQREPRLIEVLWALQFFSQPARPKAGHEEQFVGGYPGGLRAFTFDLINDSLDLIGTHRMRAFGSVRYDRAAAAAVFNEMPSRWRASFDHANVCEAAFHNADSTGPAPLEAFVDSFPISRRRQLTAVEIARAVRIVNREECLEMCVSAARESLADYLRELCEAPHVCFRGDPNVETWNDAKAPWFFADVASALLRFIDRRKDAVFRLIADTEISREVTKWLGRANATRRGVLISGDSRFGKTEAVEAFCEAYPGRARLVETPPSNSESDLLRAVAKAIGLEISPTRRGYQLREEIGYLIEQAGLMLVFDEAQGIFPSSFGRNTPPARLNWIRRSVLDRGIPAAFICTPQSYENARKKFLRATNFAIQQWDERLLRTVHLPKEVGHEDLLAIARIRFPSLDVDYLEYVVNAVKLTERNYVSDVSRIADLARFNAEEGGRAEPNFADIKSAIADALPGVTPAAATISSERETQVATSSRINEQTKTHRRVNPLRQARPHSALSHA